MASASEHVTAFAVEASSFPDMVRQYRISGVPVTIVNEETEILGALPEDAFVSQTLEKFTRDNSPSAK